MFNFFACLFFAAAGFLVMLDRWETAVYAMLASIVLSLQEIIKHLKDK